MTHGHEQWWGDCLREWGGCVEGAKGGNIETTVIASSKQYNKKWNENILLQSNGPEGKSLPLAGQQQSSLNYYVWVSLSAQLGWLGRRWHWVLQNTYYIRPPYQGQETYQLYLLHRNKYREAAKIKRQRNTSQLKEQNKTPETEINKMVSSNLLDQDFKTLVIRMLSELSENFNKDIGNMKIKIKNIKKSQS